MNKYTFGILPFIFIISFVILVIVLAPIAGIWSLNTLFGLAIPFTFDTWMAAFFLSAVFGGGVGVASRKK
jgi:hypothetical protein